MPSRRRRARIIALQTLYEADTTGHEAMGILERLLQDALAPEEIAEFARELVGGATEHREYIDSVIAKVAPAWPLEQMAAVDRNILRLAILEILLNNRTPLRAAINEAVELAKTFGSDNSAKFVNGVLGSVSLMKG
ncbi:MAG: transcription antitermination factor NusB [Dehalococcoidia bacterium]|nr:transcription antitermination factor NusB [Dehalococcoidia bacterium]